jgi:hypothetical protein
MPPTPPAKAAAERAPATETSSVNEGVEALTQMIRLETTRSPQQRRPSSTSSTPRVWRGDATLPGARRGGSPRRVSGERESSLADPHGGPAATECMLKLLLHGPCQREIIHLKSEVPMQTF